MEAQRTHPSGLSKRVPTRNIWFLFASLGGVLLVLASYSNFFQQSFHLSDQQIIQHNLYVQGIDSIPHLFSDPRENLNLSAHVPYRPVLSLSISLDHWLAGGLNPRQFHFTQFIFVALLGIGFAVFCQFILDRAYPHWSNKYIALVSALWCCVHFAHAETLMEISSRASLLATLGVVGSFVMYGGLPACRPSQIYLLPMMLGTLAHPLGVLFVPLLFLYGLLFEKRLSCREMLSANAWPKVRHALGKILPAFFTGVGLLLFLDSVTPFQKTDGSLVVETVLLQPVLWFDYLYRFIIPMGWVHEMAGQGVPPVGDMRFFGGIIWMLFLVRMVWVCSCKKELRPVAFGIMWFILGVFSLGSPKTWSAQPQVLFPFMGLMLALQAWIVYRLRHWRRYSPLQFSLMIPVVFLSGVLVLGVHAVGTYQLHERGFSNKSYPELRDVRNQGSSEQNLENS